MRYSILVKFLAILLSALALLTAFAGGASIVALEGAGLYVNRLDELQDHEYSSIAKSLSADYTELYAAEELGKLSYLLKENLYSDPEERSDVEYWHVQLLLNGREVAAIGTPAAVGNAVFIKEFQIAPHYPIASMVSPGEMEELREAQKEPDPTLPPDGSSEPPKAETPKQELVPEGYDYTSSKTIWSSSGPTTYYLYYYPAPEYTATVHLQEEMLESSSLHILTSLYPHRYSAIAFLALGIVLFFAGMVFLCWSAGRSPSGALCPGGLNRIPLDIFALGVTVCEYLLFLLLSNLYDWIGKEGPHPGNLSLIAVNLAIIALLGIGFVFAFAAQVKVPGYWWKHSFTGWLLTQLWRGLRFLWAGCGKLARLLPVIWQWLLIGSIMGIVLCIAGLLAAWNTGAVWLLVLILILCCLIVVYGGYCFGSLMAGAKRMSEGDLSRKVPTKYLVGSFRDFAQQLNTLSETAKAAAEHEMRSERMKSELITNVSHDIKTPLTSIINFVDLLQKPHTQEEETEYLEVLSRQSARMKKLIEDLLELSKANTGNIVVNLTEFDAVEAVNQALGEFADKLDSVSLTPVFSPPEEPLMVRADGRLAWRVMSNLLTNAVKYALPGTRLYIDLVRIEDNVLLSLKNISKEALTLHADDLMERFVRGDTSRNSDGSGLGLNIAKSLMEVQNGQMQLLLDGDLFKVTLIFPAV